MNPGPYISLVFCPDTGRELAAKKPEISAVVINAMYGILVLAAIAPQMLSMFTPLLAVIVVILFGPLIGFIISSLYTRVEMTVGRRLGGKASLDQLYRLFAWSFLPAGLSLLLYSIIMLALDKPSTTTELVSTIPSLILVCCAIRNYCSNIISTQQFSRVRGVVSISLSFILFLVLLAGGLGFITIILKLSTGETLLSLVNQL